MTEELQTGLLSLKAYWKRKQNILNKVTVLFKQFHKKYLSHFWKNFIYLILKIHIVLQGKGE